MFTLYQSNRMEALVQILQQRLRKHRSDKPILEPDTLLVYNFGSAKWLKLQLAEAEGISANLDDQLPATFTWRLFTVLLDEGLPDAADFSSAAVTWKLMALLPGLLEDEEFATLKHYLAGEGNPQLRRYQLSEKIADLFDQYLVYRPDWLLQWQAGRNPIEADAMRDQQWQPKLWQALIQFTSSLADQSALHRADLHKLLLGKLERLQRWPAELPRHISIFGISALPPQHLEIVNAISNFCQVDLYLLNPCQHYWGDIVPPAARARKIVKEIATESGLADTDYLMVGNPLLASMGQQGREFTDLLLEIDELQIEDCFVELDKSADMLSFLQQEILNLEFRNQNEPPDEVMLQTNAGKKAVDTGDSSLQIHSCHSHMREVEVLRDQLLELFNQDSGLAPHEVIVMMPDVSVYAPYIESVFSRTHETELRIPYSLSDRRVQHDSPVLTSFLSLLALPKSRLTAPEVMDWLQTAAIARRFVLDEEDLQTLTRWIAESGIRWGWHGQSKQQWQLPEENHNTWQFGLERMVLGYAMQSSDGLYDGILPYDPVEGGQAELLGKLLKFTDLLWDLRGELSQARSITEWHGLINRLLDSFYLPDREEELELALIRHAITSMLEEVTHNHFGEALAPEVIEFYLTARLQQPESGHGFLSNGVTFCNLVPMRSIPFKTVCLLGMNDEDFPRRSQIVGFDLVSLTASRKGDRSRRNDDRYLFLEAMLAARNHLYISFVGVNSKDNSTKVPSVLLNELLEYCAQVFALRDDIDSDVSAAHAERSLLSWLVRRHPLQPFDPQYFNGEDSRFTSYSGKWYRALVAAQAEQVKSQGIEFCPDPLPDRKGDGDIEVTDLTGFFRNPGRYFFREVLGVYFEEPLDRLEDSEAFSLNGLDQYTLGKTALEALIAGESRMQWRERVQASGSILPGMPGVQQLQKPWTQASAVNARIAGHLFAEARSLSIDLPYGDKRIVGEIDGIFADHLLFYRTGSIKSRQKLDYWIRHLCLASAGYATTTLLVSDAKSYRYQPLEAEQAWDVLSPMVELFEERYMNVLPLIPEVSYSWQQEIGKEDSDRQSAVAAAVKSWGEDAYMSEATESGDPCYGRLFDIPDDIDSEFERVAGLVYGELLSHLVEEKL
jgi:exodeoxyribonuclease V gamma subunit